MAKGNNGDASTTLVTRELKLPDGDYVVVDEQGHEAFVPHRIHGEREPSLATRMTGEDV
jgi:hypothetical protein